jgi:GT2 family glycosyltransferase
MELAGKLARQAPSDAAVDADRADRLRALLTPSSFWSPLYLEESAWLDHGAFAFWLIEATRPRSFVELGTHGGYSYFTVCQTVKALGLPTKCYAVDTWQGDEHAGFYDESIYRRVHDHNERHYASFSRLVRATFAEALSHFPDGSIDLLHIDGRHFYEDVKEDYETWRVKLSDRAVVFFHDINVRERNFGVFKLWEELKVQYPSFDFMHGNGLGIIGYGENLPVGILPLFEAAKDERTQGDVRMAYSRLGAAFKAQFEAAQTRDDLTEKLTAQVTRAAALEGEARELAVRSKQHVDELTAAWKGQEHRANALEAETVERGRRLTSQAAEFTAQRENADELFKRTTEDFKLQLQTQADNAKDLFERTTDEFKREMAAQGENFERQLRTQTNDHARQLKAQAKTLNAEIAAVTENMLLQIRAHEHRADALQAQVDARDLAISRLQTSFSWRITKPVRFASRLMGKAFRAVRRPVRIVGGLVYRYTPLPPSVKARIVSLLLHLFAPLVRNTGFYNNWFERRRLSAQALMPGEGTAGAPKEVARAIEIDYSAAVPFIYPTLDIEAPRLAVFLHLFHENLGLEFQRYLRNIPFSFDLFITTDSPAKVNIITRQFTDWNLGQVTVRVTPNRGRDIAPKLLGFREVYDRYPFVLHLHSKVSDHAGVLANWRGLLLETLIGSPEIVTSVFDAFARRSDIGMIAPQHFEVVRHWINWGGNFKTAEALARRMGENALSMDKVVDFPSGSMFWARSAALKPLLDLNLTVDDFEEEKGQIDGTIAHAIERLYFYVCERAGFGWMKIAPRALYPQTPAILTINTPANLGVFVNDYGLKLTGPNLPPQREAHPVPALAPRALIDRLQSRALGCDMEVDPTAKVCVGIVTYNNTANQLRRVVDSARHALKHAGLARAARISLIDNGTSSEILLREADVGGDLLHYLPSAGNIGFGAAHNRLMADWFAAGGDFYIATNPDGAFHPECVIALMQMMRTHGNRALIEAMQFPAEHPKVYDPYTFETPWTSGACLVIPRALYEQTGGFDETFFMYCEDVDFAWRAKALGFAVRICPRALFLHEVTNREPAPRTLKMIYGSGIILARKWGDPDFEGKLVGELEDLGGEAPAQQPAPVLGEWRRIADFKHHFTFAKMRW